MAEHDVPRGIACNNPGWLPLDSGVWHGQVPPNRRTDMELCEFVLPLDGVRALGRAVRLAGSDGHATVRALAGRFAPPATEARVAQLAMGVGSRPDQVLDLEHPATLRAVVVALIVLLNGCQPYPPELVADALTLALNT